MQKKIFLFLLIAALPIGAGTACRHQPEVKLQDKIPWENIKKEAGDFSYHGNSFSISADQVKLPDAEKITATEFEVLSDSSEMEKIFLQNARKFMGEKNFKKDQVKYHLKDPKTKEYIDVPMQDATEKQRSSRDSYLMYFDGTYQEILWKTSMMCELGCNTVPKKYLEDEDFSSEWKHTGLDLGTLAKSYEIPEDDVSDVSYSLSDGECPLAPAIEYVEKHVKNDYRFAGSDLLDYSVFRVDVRIMEEDVYYYQFEVKAQYQGVALNKDRAVYDNTDLIEDSHTVSMFTKNKIGYLWSCLHSYERIAEQEELTELLSLQSACAVAEKNLTGKRKFEIKSVELLYLTELEYDKDNTGVTKVKAYPAYHFYVANPALAGYERLYFDVNAQTGEFMTGKAGDST